MMEVKLLEMNVSHVSRVDGQEKEVTEDESDGEDGTDLEGSTPCACLENAKTLTAKIGWPQAAVQSLKSLDSWQHLELTLIVSILCHGQAVSSSNARSERLSIDKSNLYTKEIKGPKSTFRVANFLKHWNFEKNFG